MTNIRTGNPDLKAERSRNFNVGAVWSPDGDTSIGLDWYRIEQDNLVKPDSAQFIVDNPTLFSQGTLVATAASGSRSTDQTFLWMRVDS